VRRRITKKKRTGSSQETSCPESEKIITDLGNYSECDNGKKAHAKMNNSLGQEKGGLQEKNTRGGEESGSISTKRVYGNEIVIVKRTLTLER